jgi:hypothetical protein
MNSDPARNDLQISKSEARDARTGAKEPFENEIFEKLDQKIQP